MSELQVYKFGGASVRDAENINKVTDIIHSITDKKTVIVVSATGKTTNHLEKVVESYYNSNGDAHDLMNELKDNHIQILHDLEIQDPEVYADINDLLVEVEWILEEEPDDPFDYLYDQIVSIGELISSKVLYAATQKKGVNVGWFDIRDCLFTDEIHREAKVDWDYSTEKIKKKVNELLSTNDIIITQGFIGSTRDNNTTTLGREGSDYTAAIISYCCDAQSMAVWKDVPGVLTGDPRTFENVTLIGDLTYKEAIEMTYYGAKVIHPKTIKPLQNKNIPMYVKPFNSPDERGTKIHGIEVRKYPPIIVIEKNQALISIAVRDFSFVAEDHLSEIFKVLSDLRIKVNMMRNSAISFTLSVGNIPSKIEKLKSALKKHYKVKVENDMEVVTIRHYNEVILAEMKKDKLVLFEEKLDNTVQMVVKSIPLMKRKDD